MRISDIKSIDEYEKPSVKNAFYFFNYTRYFVMILVLLCLTVRQTFLKGNRYFTRHDFLA